MKKIVLAVLVAGVVAAIVPQATAATRAFESSVLNVSAAQAENVYQRYFTPAKTQVGPNCTGNCAGTGLTCIDGGTTCQMASARWNTTRFGYRGYQENMFQFGDAPNGTVFHTIWDMEKNANGTNHQGYYAWTTGAVTDTETDSWFDANCTGTSAAGCLGNATSTNSKPQTNVPSTSGSTAGSLAVIGGLSPIPVVHGRGAAYDKLTGTFHIGWDAVTSVGDAAGAAAAGYELYFAKSTAACTAPAGNAYTKINRPEPVVGSNQADVLFSEVGMASPSEQACVFFAVKIHFASTADGTKMISRFLGANGQGISTGLAANVTELAARYVGQNNVSVTWKTSLEDGLRGFYVSRATTQNGTYSRVSELIPAKGQASAYSFIDTVQAPAGVVRAGGLFYKVETVDMDDASVSYGPVKATADGGKVIRDQRGRKGSR